MKKILVTVGIICLTVLSAQANIRISFKGRCPTFADSIKNCCGSIITDSEGNLTCTEMCDSGEVCTPAGCCENGTDVYRNASGAYQCCKGTVCKANCCESGQECIEGNCCQTGQVLCNGECQDKPTVNENNCEKRSDDECSVISKCTDGQECDGAGNCVEAVVCKDGEKICGTDEKWCCASDNECGNTVGQCCSGDKTKCCDGIVYNFFSPEYDLTEYYCCPAGGKIYRSEGDDDYYHNACCEKGGTVVNGADIDMSDIMNFCCYSNIFWNTTDVGREEWNSCCLEKDKPTPIVAHCDKTDDGDVMRMEHDCFPSYVAPPNPSCCEKALHCSSGYAYAREINHVYEGKKLVYYELECICWQ